MDRAMLFSGAHNTLFARGLLVAGLVGSAWGLFPVDNWGPHWQNGNSPFPTPAQCFAGDPTVDNPFWRKDPFKATPVPTLNNPYWREDPFKGTPVPTLNNPYWGKDPFKGMPVPR